MKMFTSIKLSLESNGEKSWIYRSLLAQFWIRAVTTNCLKLYETSLGPTVLFSCNFECFDVIFPFSPPLRSPPPLAFPRGLQSKFSLQDLCHLIHWESAWVTGPADGRPSPRFSTNAPPLVVEGGGTLRGKVKENWKHRDKIAFLYVVVFKLLRIFFPLPSPPSLSISGHFLRKLLGLSDKRSK